MLQVDSLKQLSHEGSPCFQSSQEKVKKKETFEILRKSLGKGKLRPRAGDYTPKVTEPRRTGPCSLSAWGSGASPSILHSAWSPRRLQKRRPSWHPWESSLASRTSKSEGTWSCHIALLLRCPHTGVREPRLEVLRLAK